MAKINVFSAEWCDLIFEGRNTKYGAYDMRAQTEKRHRIAMIIIFSMLGAVLTLPSLIKEMIPEREEQNVVVTSLAQINVETVERKPRERTLDIPIPQQPLPQLRSSVKNVAPVITPDQDVPEDEEGMKTQEELLSTNVAISVATVEGTDEKEGVDVAELDLNQRLNIDVENEPPLVVVDRMPEFPGGTAAMMKFLADNMNYPDLARDNNIQGTVVLTFVVGTDGSITNITVIRSLDPDCDAEAVRVVRMMPKWSPGMQNDRAVRVQYNLPVRFVIR